MKQGSGIVVSGRFVEQHGIRKNAPGTAPASGQELTESASGILRSVRETWTAGREFARQCQSMGLADKAFRK